MRHLVIPDTQIKPGQDYSFCEWIGKYIVHVKPDKIICLGDWADMPSLSSYDVGKKSFEGRRYKADVEASIEAMTRLFKPLNEFNAKAKKNKEKQYHPELILTLGNHENRIERATESDPKLDGTLSIEDLRYKDFGWTVLPFLQPIVIDGVAYCHYFTSGVLGRPCTSAQMQLNKKHMSVISGHQQGLQSAMDYRADGKRITSVISGSCYPHDESYMNYQGNKHWRGLLVLHEVADGEFDLMQVSLNYLEKKYNDKD
jgi:hypothetical protein